MKVSLGSAPAALALLSAPRVTSSQKAADARLPQRPAKLRVRAGERRRWNPGAARETPASAGPQTEKQKQPSASARNYRVGLGLDRQARAARVWRSQPGMQWVTSPAVCLTYK